MSLFKKAIDFLVGSPTSVENALEISNTITKGLDVLVYTSEEKEQDKQKLRETLLGFWGTFANENSEQSKARRDLAKDTMKVWLSLILITAVLWKIDKEWAGFLFDIIKAMTWLVGMIAGTYFVPYQVKKIWRGKNAE